MKTDVQWVPWDKDNKRWDKDKKPNPFEPNPIMGTCPKCGLELRRVMHYYCSRNGCPTGLGGVQC